MCVCVCVSGVCVCVCAVYVYVCVCPVYVCVSGVCVSVRCMCVCPVYVCVCVCPVYWPYDYTLRLYPVPDLVLNSLRSKITVIHVYALLKYNKYG